MAQPFDVGRLETTGEALPIAEGVPTFSSPSRIAAFTVSQNGYLVGQLGAESPQSRLVWKDRHGQAIGTLAGPAGVIGDIQASPDWKTLVTSNADKNADDLWLYDIARGVSTRFTFGPQNVRSPIWSPDGRTVYYASNRNGPFNLFRRASNGAGADELVFADDANHTPQSVSPDGTLLLVESFRGPRNSDIMILPLTGPDAGRKTALGPFLATPFNEFHARFSPDGKWVAYASQESGLPQIYVTPFPGRGGKQQVSSAGGGAEARWRRDGKELFYITLDGQLMAAEVTLGKGVVDLGPVQRLFDGIVTTRGPTYEVSDNGEKFLVVDDGIRGARPLTLIQNWTAALKK